MLWKFLNECVGVVGVRGRRNVDIFVQKSGGTPNTRVKKLGVTPNPYKFFASAGASRAPADAKNVWGLQVNPNFLTAGLGVTHFFNPTKI